MLLKPQLLLKQMTRVFPLVLSGMLFVGCGSSPIPPIPPPTAPLQSTRVYAASLITAQNALGLVELDRWETTALGPAAATAFDEKTQQLVTAHTSGIVQRIQLMSKHIESFNAAPISLRATVFGQSGQIVATSAGITSTVIITNPYKSSDLFGVRMWNVPSGLLQNEITSTIVDRDIALTPNGDWIVETDRGGAFVSEVASGRLTSIVGFMDEGRSFGGLDAISFDALGEYLASADRNGLIRLDRLDKGELNYVGVIATPAYRNRTIRQWNPHAIAFDPTRRWLALIANDQLLIWTVRTYSLHLQSQVSESDNPSAALCFSPDGTLLAVGTINGWQIWDVSKKQLLIAHQDTPVYAVTFSSNGQLFAYGDAKGGIHVWGVPDK